MRSSLPIRLAERIVPMRHLPLARALTHNAYEFAQTFSKKSLYQHNLFPSAVSF